MFHPLYSHLRHKWELQNQNDRQYFPEYPDKHHGLSVHAVYPKTIFVPQGPAHQKHHEQKFQKQIYSPPFVIPQDFLSIL